MRISTGLPLHDANKANAHHTHVLSLVLSSKNSCKDGCKGPRMQTVESGPRHDRLSLSFLYEGGGKDTLPSDYFFLGDD